MMLRKVVIDDRDVFRKRAIHTNSSVSYWADELSCEGHLSNLEYRHYRGAATAVKGSFGISKQETYVSKHWLINGHRGVLNGAAGG